MPGRFTVTFQPIKLQHHRGGKILPALPTRGGPHPLQHLQRVIGVLQRTRFAPPLGNTAAQPRR